ncbi:MAG TPA: FAD-dependent oxidoreductase [Thermoleophilaceae bacterium]
MKATKPPLRVVIAGGGPAALELLLALRELAAELVDIELIAPTTDFVYRPMRVTEPFDGGEPPRFSLPSIVRDCGGVHRLGALTAVDVDRHRATLDDGGELGYDVLAVAIGAAESIALPGALTFEGDASRRAFGRLLDELEEGRLRRVVFAVPAGVVWSMPLYELALMTAAHCRDRGVEDVELTLVTPEDEPLALFGLRASAKVLSLLRESGIAVKAGAYPTSVQEGQLLLTGGMNLAADRVVTLPRLVGRKVHGLPQDSAGFIPTDGYGRVRRAKDVYAAGDATTFAVKQGGLATQQAFAAAESIAAAAGAAVVPHPFRPVLRGLLLTGGLPNYLRAELRGGTGDDSLADVEPLWWPPGKIAGGRLSHYLAAQETSARLA